MLPSYRRHSRPARLTLLLLVAEIVVLVLAFDRLRQSWQPAQGSVSATLAFAPALSRDDILPTPTPDTSRPPRSIVFPDAGVSASIIPAGRTATSWETRHLQDAVGHLSGTSWLDDFGGNIVLAGHVENASGEPGPFAHLFTAHLNARVVLRDGTREEHYRVTAIETAAPNALQYVAQDGRRRLTLITCTDWDSEAETYLGRLIVVAEPLDTPG
ncbi:MAG: class F sortase [Chloroflexi bacterium]|nr:class F sortase [Chloroflexota bacterium]